MTPGEESVGGLPDPPPSAPARREAAIDAALRAFSGEPAREPSRAPPPPRPAWRQPQFAGLLAATLAVLIGGPVLWLTADRGAPPAQREAVSTADIAPPAGSAPPANVVVAPPALATRPAPQTIVPAGVVQPSLKTAPLEVPPPPMPMVAAAPAPPPAAPAALAAKSAESAADNGITDVVVTASRSERRAPGYAGSGDWNACTVDDPRQDLDRCRARLGRDADAPALAEGLERAWEGDTAGALAAFDRAVAAAPRSAMARLNRGLLRASQGDTSGAAADLDVAVRLAPHAARTHFALGRLLRRNGDPRAAQAEFDRAAELDPAYEDLNE